MPNLNLRSKVAALFAFHLLFSFSAFAEAVKRPYEGYWLRSGVRKNFPLDRLFNAGKYGTFPVFFAVDADGNLKAAEEPMVSDFKRSFEKHFEERSGLKLEITGTEKLTESLVETVAVVRAEKNPEQGIYLSRVPADRASETEKKTGTLIEGAYLCNTGACFVLNESKDKLTLRSVSNPLEVIATYHRLSKERMKEVVDGFVEQSAYALAASLSVEVDDLKSVLGGARKQVGDAEEAKVLAEVLKMADEIEAVAARAERLAKKLDKKAADAVEELSEASETISDDMKFSDVAARVKQIRRLAKQVTKELDRVEAELK